MLKIKLIKQEKIFSIFSLSLALSTYSETTLQFFSPRLPELGKYGKVPVNHFNGLTNIPILLLTN